MKKIASIIIITAVFITFAPFVHAAEVSNVDDESVINIVASWIFNIFVHNDNSANITNDITSSSNTGGNEIKSKDDMSGTTIVTGDAMSASNLENNANNNAIGIDVESPDGTSDIVGNVGDESTVNINTEDRLNTDIENNNDVTVDNVVSSDSTSGDNLVDSGDDLDDTTMNTGFSGSVTSVSNLFNTDVLQIIRTIRSSIL